MILLRKTEKQYFPGSLLQKYFFGGEYRSESTHGHIFVRCMGILQKLPGKNVPDYADHLSTRGFFREHTRAPLTQLNRNLLRIRFSMSTMSAHPTQLLNTIVPRFHWILG